MLFKIPIWYYALVRSKEKVSLKTELQTAFIISFHQIRSGSFGGKYERTEQQNF